MILYLNRLYCVRYGLPLSNGKFKDLKLNDLNNLLFKDKLKKYKLSKGTIQIPFDEPLPEKLIKEIVNYRVKENMTKEKLKTKK